MSENAKYEAQKKKLDGLCEEHDLTYRFRHDVYPISLTIKPIQGTYEQLSMLAEADGSSYISPDASLVFYKMDGEVTQKISGTFTISETLMSKIRNIFKKLVDYWLQYFFRDLIERQAISSSAMPVIDEAEADDDDEPPAEDDEDGEDDEDDTESDADAEESPDDELLTAATLLVRQENKASVSLLQRRLKIGYARASHLMDLLEQAGVVGPYTGSTPREVLPTDVPDDAEA